MTCRHSGRHVYVALGCVFDYAAIACALRWGVALVGYYHYWVLLTPMWDPPFQVQVRCRQLTLIRDRTYEESRIVALIYIFCKYIWVVFICIRVM